MIIRDLFEQNSLFHELFTGDGHPNEVHTRGHHIIGTVLSVPFNWYARRCPALPFNRVATR
jgi:hypothetical protein